LTIIGDPLSFAKVVHCFICWVSLCLSPDLSVKLQMGQGNDVGSQYRSGIYFHTPDQKEEAIASLKEYESRLGKKIATEILPAAPFYMAEEYHQQYLEKGGGRGKGQSAAKMCNDPIRCYG